MRQGHETEHRRAVGAQRRPPPRSAAACPHAPLPLRPLGASKVRTVLEQL